MNRIRVALFLSALMFLAVPSMSFAQVPDKTSSRNFAQSEQRTQDIEAVRSDIADLSKFSHDAEYLPKGIYQRDSNTSSPSRP
jgi:hypothetical protein